MAKKYEVSYDEKCLLDAIKQNHKGMICARCKRPNLFVDDCGWLHGTTGSV